MPVNFEEILPADGESLQGLTIDTSRIEGQDSVILKIPQYVAEPGRTYKFRVTVMIKGTDLKTSMES